MKQITYLGMVFLPPTFMTVNHSLYTSHRNGMNNIVFFSKGHIRDERQGNQSWLEWYHTPLCGTRSASHDRNHLDLHRLSKSVSS